MRHKNRWELERLLTEGGTGVQAAIFTADLHGVSYCILCLARLGPSFAVRDCTVSPENRIRLYMYGGYI